MDQTTHHNSRRDSRRSCRIADELVQTHGCSPLVVSTTVHAWKVRWHGFRLTDPSNIEPGSNIQATSHHVERKVSSADRLDCPQEDETCQVSLDFIEGTSYSPSKFKDMPKTMKGLRI